MHLPRDARTALFPKHSDRTFFRSTRSRAFSRRTRDCAPFPKRSEPRFFCNDHSALSRAFSRRTRDCAPFPKRSEPRFFCNDHSALSRAFSRRTRDRAPFPKRSEPRFFCNDHSARSRAFSVTITLLGAALFPDGLGIMHLPRDARTALFPKHSDRTFFRSTRSRAFSRRTRDRAPFPKRSEPRFFCNDHSALNATRHKTRIFYLNTKLRLSQTTAVI